MKKKLSTRSFPISEKFRWISIILFYLSIALVVLAVLAFPVFLIIGIITANGALILTGLYSILASIAGLLGFQILILLSDSLAILMHRQEKDLTKEEMEHFNNSFSVPDELDKKMAEAKAKKAERKAAEAAAAAQAQANQPIVPPPAPQATPTDVPPTPTAPVSPTPAAPAAAPTSAAPANGWTCTCGQVNEEDGKFCANCGSPKPASLF